MEINTWGQALDYTFKTRHSWRHGNGRKTAEINSAHFTRLRGTSFPVKRVTQPIISEVSIELEDEGKSDATINRIVSAVSTVLNHCAFDGLIAAPCKFRRRKENEGRTLYYTKDEVNRLCNVSTNVFARQDLSDIIQFAAYHGLRQGEILKLRVKDIDWAGERILVGGEQAVVTKAGNHRVVPIHASCLQMMTDRCSQSQDPSFRLFGTEWDNKDILLRAFVKANKLVPKSEEYVFHTLRHTYGTWLAEAGVPIRTIMALMGHKRVETTLRYAKATDTALVSAMNAI
jgi:integrase